MSVMRVPALATYANGPSLGPQLTSWMETFLVHGPGDVRGEPYRLDEEKRKVLFGLYALQPDGRRRFKRGAVSVRKGWAKTELAAAITAGELHPLAPVRFSHLATEGEESWWGYRYKAGEPVGMGVKDPYIPMVAYTEEQSEELAYAALCVMLGEGDLANDFDIGLERIIALGEKGEAVGKAVALATSPNARDGARTSFQVFDETHRLILDQKKKAHQTMMANLPKRKAADPWSLEITTSYEPGELSVAEGTMDYARLVRQGKVPDSRLFFYHRQAGDHHDLSTVEGLRNAVLEACGDTAVWTDVDGIVELALDPQTDRSYWERVWLNRPVRAASQVFDMGSVGDALVGDWRPEDGALVTVGFDGSQVRDATALVGTDLLLGRQFLIACWENPGGVEGEDWEVPAGEVDQAVAECFRRWRIPRFYADPYYWDTHVAEWIGKFTWRNKGKSRPAVFSWATNRNRIMALSVKAYVNAIKSGEWSFAETGDPKQKLREHLGNARKHDIHMVDEDEVPLYVMRKERPDSPFKIDAAMAGCLSWEAYRDAIAAGERESKRSKVPVSIL